MTRHKKKKGKKKKQYESLLMYPTENKQHEQQTMENVSITDVA